MDPRKRVMFRIVVRCFAVFAVGALIGLVGTEFNSAIFSALGGLLALGAIVTGMSAVVVTSVVTFRRTSETPLMAEFDQKAWITGLAIGATLGLVLWLFSPLNDSPLICGAIGVGVSLITQRVMRTRYRA